MILAGKIKDRGVKIKGLVTLKSFLIECEEALALDTILRTSQNITPESYNTMIRRLEALCFVRQAQYQNLVVLTGRAVFARLLAGDTTYSGAINYGALGTGTTAVAAANTQLATEVARKVYASRTQSSAQTTIDFYYSKADTNGTYQEFGTFIDGTATANSGQMFNRVLTGGWTKSSAEAMTVSIQFDFNDA